jgi:hypothetical protein
MSYSYYIKNRTSATNTNSKGTLLMDEIYNCCKNKNFGRSKIHTQNKEHVLTNIVFNDLKTNLKYYENKIHEMDCGELDNYYLFSSYEQNDRSSLICLEKNNIVYTLLTFYFDGEKNCIVIDAFCSKPGGGSIFNFLINAIKCGIKICKKKHNISYERKFYLSSLNNPSTLGFYTKYGLKLENPNSKPLKRDVLVPLTRAFSAESNTDTEPNEMDDAMMVDIDALEKYGIFDKKSDDNIDYYDTIEELRNRNQYYKGMFLRPDPPTNAEAIDEAREYNEQLNNSRFIEAQYSPSDERNTRKRGRTIKKRSRKNKTIKKTQNPSNKNKYNPNKYNNKYKPKNIIINITPKKYKHL